MFRFSIPDPSSKDNIADWVEIFVAFSNGEFSKSELSSYIEESSGSEPDEFLVDSVWQELVFREILYGDKTPFKVDGRTVKSAINWNDHPEYMTCLIFSLVGNSEDSAKSGKLFERITGEAMKNFLHGSAAVFGHPRNIRLEDMCGTMKEKFNCYPPSYRKDRGLDVFAWKPFGDSRASQIVILMQCAAGHNWKTKLTELSIDAWKRYIHFASPPIKGFSIPCIISDASSLEEASFDGGIIIDRVRLYRNIASSQGVNQNLKRELLTWCKRRLKEINR